VHLARLLRLDEVTSVAIPTLEQEAARDLVRAREDCRGDMMRARHRLSKLLLRHGIVYYGGTAWTGKHDIWLRRQRFENPTTQVTFESDYDAVLVTTATARTPGCTDRDDGCGFRVHPSRASAVVPARDFHAYRVRAGR
jgi:transposase